MLVPRENNLKAVKVPKVPVHHPEMIIAVGKLSEMVMNFAKLARLFVGPFAHASPCIGHAPVIFIQLQFLITINHLALCLTEIVKYSNQ